ncbi:hypothetical protein DICPUDRAFT_91961 [Dictyostelium purpureum]|uniref:Uncharacterized protein n=1 Tax=Dictyostelium purpureum TaxID=5786 RepID=F0ZJU8_DICPU|nr:uncharacterized protein DICPUDRAFT_91961 [Dictyostelium purpureum]EGC35801.1 hypothetical protein DICPUDRAFT_91961 [Dictyostelium purpureum]|eukprot:XP_003287695.1 hypothetical protein DICPUDRAFT_91961 [Dictyostelium purpureum]
MTITDFFVPAIAFTKVSDITKAYFKSPGNPPASQLAYLQNPPLVNNAPSLYNYVYAEIILNSVLNFSTTDAYGAGPLITSLGTLQSNIYTTISGFFPVLLANLPNCFNTAVVATAKYDTIKSNLNAQRTLLTNLKTQCSTLINSINTTKNALPVNQPNTASYNAVVTCYTNVVAGINIASTQIDAASSLIGTIGTNLDTLSVTASYYLDDLCSDAEYMDSVNNTCSNICYSINSILGCLNEFGKTKAL